VHQLDEARDDAARPGPLDDGAELAVVVAAEDDRVDLHLVEADGARRSMPASTVSSRPRA